MELIQGSGTLAPIGDIGLINRLIAQPDGRILAAGSFLTYDSVTKPGLMRIATDGKIDPSFNPPPGYWTTDAALLPNGQIVVTADGVFREAAERLNADGSENCRGDVNNVVELRAIAALILDVARP